MWGQLLTTYSNATEIAQWGATKLWYYSYIVSKTTTINIVGKMSKFADTKLCHRARNPDDITKLQEDINKLIEWAKNWQMSFNVDKYSVMHIGHNNMESNYNMSNQQRDLGIIITEDLKCQQQRKAGKRPAEYWGSLPAI